MARPSTPDTLAVVAGTATEIGKTWVTAAVAKTLSAQGRRVAVRKPAQSYGPDEAEAGATDAHVLGGATGEPPEDVCPPERWYPVPMAPPMAADALNRPAFTIADLAAELRWPAGLEIGLVETAGGVRSPLASDGDTVSLAQAVDPHVVVLVADAGLGTLNAVRLCAEALAPVAARLVVMLNRFDPADDLHRRNRDWLVDRDQLTVRVTVDDLAADLAG
jgi:dethiobiotin synthetase